MLVYARSSINANHDRNGRSQHIRVDKARHLPVVSIVVPCWGYLIGSLLYIWLNPKKELQWLLQVVYIYIHMYVCVYIYIYMCMYVNVYIKTPRCLNSKKEKTHGVE